MSKIQLTESELKEIINEATIKILNEAQYNLNPSTIAADKKTAQDIAIAARGAKELSRAKQGALNNKAGQMLYNTIKMAPQTRAAQSVAPATTQAVKRGTRVGRAVGSATRAAGRAIGTAGKAAAAFATTPAGIAATAAAAVAAGTMIYLNNRNKKGLEALKQGTWDGKYPWQDQEIVPWKPITKKPGNGQPPVTQTGTASDTNKINRDNMPALPDLNNSTANNVISQKAASALPQMQTQTQIGVPKAQAVSTINNPRIAQMQKNGRSAEAIGNAAARQQNRTLKNMGLNQTQFNSKQLGNN